MNIYVTKEVHIELGEEIVKLLLELRVSMPKLDYLAIVRLKPEGEGRATLCMEQEQPYWEMEKKIEYSVQREMKIYMIEEGGYITVLFAEQY